MDKQVLNSRIDVQYFYNSNWISFFPFPINFKYTNSNFRFVPEYFADKATDKALSGKIRSNLRGYRLRVNLDWAYLNNANQLFNSLSNLVIGSRKIAAQTTASGAGSSTTALVTTDPIFPGSQVDGLKLKIASNAEVTITATNVNESTLSAAQSWSSGATVIMYAESSFPLRLRFRPDATKSDEITMVFSETSLEALMQYTIFKQPINLMLESETLFDVIPSWFVVP